MDRTTARARERVHQMACCEYLKYHSGAVHWTALSRNPRVHILAFDARYRRCVDLLKRAGPATRPVSILDLGCGDGTLLYYLRKAFPSAELSGIDGSSEGIYTARAMLARHSILDVELRAVDFIDLGSVAWRYGAVTCLEVIEHVEDTVGFLSKIRTLLSDGGYLVISTPVRLREFPMDRDHKRELFQEEFKTMVRDAGFEVIEHVQIVPVYYLVRYFKAVRFIVGKTKLFRTIYNLMNILFGHNVFLKKAPDASYELYETQLILARRV